MNQPTPKHRVMLALLLSILALLNLTFEQSDKSLLKVEKETTATKESSSSSSYAKRNEDGSTKHGTIVTAYYEGPSKHTLEKYENWAKTFLTLQDPMIIFTTPTFAPLVREHRANATDKTKIVLLDLNETETVNMFNVDFWKREHEKDPKKERHKSYHVYWVWLAKMEFIRKAIEENPFDSDFFAWVDIGYFRTDTWKHQRMLQHIPHALQRDQVMMLDVHHDGHIGAGFIGGYSQGLLRYGDLFYNHLKTRHQKAFIGREEPMMDETCLLQKNLCQIVTSGKWYENHRWFYMAPLLILGQNETEASLYVPTHNTECFSTPRRKKDKCGLKGEK